MSFFKSLPDDAGPPAGPSPLSQGERELIFAFAAGVTGCQFVYVAHAEVAYA